MAVSDSHRIPSKLVGSVVLVRLDGHDRPVRGKIYQADRDGFRFGWHLGKVRCTWDRLVHVLSSQAGVQVRRSPNK